MILRLLIDALERWEWSRAYLGRQRRTEPRAYASLGRFRESSQLWPEPGEDERWDRYLRANCCDHYQALQEQCPIHPGPIMDESGFSSGAAIEPRKDCL